MNIIFKVTITTNKNNDKYLKNYLKYYLRQFKTFSSNLSFCSKFNVKYNCCIHLNIFTEFNIC